MTWVSRATSERGWWRGIATVAARVQPRRWMLVVGALAFAMAIVAGAGWILHQERLSDSAVTHTFQNEKQLARILSLLQDAEVGQRGYLLTSDRFYLEPYTAALDGIDAGLDRLASDVADNARQDANVTVLRTLVAQKLSELRQTVSRRQSGDAVGALAVLEGGQGKLLMDGIRDVLSRMQAEEERLMMLRTEAAQASVRRIELMMLALLVLCIGFALAAIGAVLRRARSAEASRDALLARFDRKLMAVMAADVIGYSRLMENDETGTLGELMALRERVDPLILQHGGRITGSAGDSILAVFPSALAAVDCAIQMQTPAPQASQGPPIQLRIGINVGDVIEQGNDVFGDTINIAARLEALAKPGGICVSRAVRDHVGKHRHIVFNDVGLQTVKNIADPVSVHEIVIQGDGVADAAREPAEIVQ